VFSIAQKVFHIIGEQGQHYRKIVFGGVFARAQRSLHIGILFCTVVIPAVCRNNLVRMCHNTQGIRRCHSGG